jgi:hypothetical protein
MVHEDIWLKFEGFAGASQGESRLVQVKKPDKKQSEKRRTVGVEQPKNEEFDREICEIREREFFSLSLVTSAATKFTGIALRMIGGQSTAPPGCEIPPLNEIRAAGRRPNSQARRPRYVDVRRVRFDGKIKIVTGAFCAILGTLFPL